MRILILSASTGGGHMAVSHAIRSHVLQQDKTAVVEIIDTFEYINPMLNKTVSLGYVNISTKTPKIYSAMYKFSKNDGKFSSTVEWLNNLFSKKLMPLLKSFEPDLILTTHAFTTTMASNLKEIGNLSIPLVCVITDYAPHKTWIAKNVDAYIVASENMIEPMTKLGVSSKKIHPLGIPINSSFHLEYDKKKTLKKMGLIADIPTILIMAGSIGVTDILQIYRHISRIDLDFQLIIITGNNKKLYKNFKKLMHRSVKISKAKSLHRRYKKLVRQRPAKLIFYTNEVHKYMKVSDFIVTKPGGLTVSEALACNLPMVIFDAIPGQEQDNAEFLVENNMAIRIDKKHSCKKTIRFLLENRDNLESMKESCIAFDKSNLSQEMFRLLQSLIRKEVNI